VICEPTLRVNSAPSPYGPTGVSVCCLGPDLLAFLGSSAHSGDLLKSIFRVTVAQTTSPEGYELPAVSGHYFLSENEVLFIPHFPFERDMTYRASFDTQRLGDPLTAESLNLEFQIPAEQTSPALTEVTHIFPSCVSSCAGSGCRTSCFCASFIGSRRRPPVLPSFRVCGKAAGNVGRLRKIRFYMIANTANQHRVYIKEFTFFRTPISH
jgi:hypothetical protein